MSDIETIDPDQWRLSAKCRDANPDVFFSEHGQMNSVAKAICSGCPVRNECLNDGIARREKGIWGGLTETERAALRRSRRLARRAERAVS